MIITAEELRSFAETVAKAKDGVCYKEIKDLNDKDKRCAVVVGWIKDESDADLVSDTFSDGEWRVAAKIAFQGKNSMLQCDYEMDWYQAWWKEEGGVFDTEILLYESTDFKRAAIQLDESYRYIKTHQQDIEWS